jgi:hypothetical protein
VAPVTDRRDHTALDADENSAASSAPHRTLRAPFARLVGNGEDRRLAVGRLAIVAGAGVVAICLLVVAVKRASRWSDEYLRGSEAYRLRFEDIELDPPPPRWIQTGRRGLLDRVRERAGLPATLSLLTVDKDAIRRDFQRESPWVRSVQRVEARYPNCLTVRLEYREPVAFVLVGRSPIFLDRDGVVLPNDDLDADSAEPLLYITGLLPKDATAAAVDGRPGLALKVAASGNEKPRLGPAQAVAKLAAFFRSRCGESDASKPCTIKTIHCFGGQLFAQTDADTLIRWGNAPGAEAPDELRADAKWTALQAWSAQHRITEIRSPSFLAFERDRIVVLTAVRPDSATPSEGGRSASQPDE